MYAKAAGIRKKRSSSAYSTAALSLYSVFFTIVSHKDVKLFFLNTSLVHCNLMKRDIVKHFIFSVMCWFRSYSLLRIENTIIIIIIIEITAGNTTSLLCTCNSLVPNAIYPIEIIVFITWVLIMHNFKEYNHCLRQNWLLIGCIQL